MSNEARISDRHVRDTIANDLGKTFLVEAAAGTGKTTSMVRRMASLVREGAIDVSELAAITFTIKAAAHLREAFQEELESQIAAHRDAAGHERLRDARARLGKCFIGTIHAFCARMLRERPVEAGLDPAFEELTENDAAALPLEFWERYTQRLYMENAPILRELSAVGVRPKDLAGMFVQLNEYSDVKIVGVPRPRPELRPACDRLIAFLARVEGELPGPHPADDDFAKLLETTRRLCASIDGEDDLAVLKLLERADRRASTTQKNWPDGKKAKRLLDEFTALRDATISRTLREWREHVHSILLRAILPAIEEFAAERRRSGRLTFQDLLLAARDLLRDHPNVRSYFQRRFRRILVDEFQDTDPIQAEIIFYLTSPQITERDWKKLRPTPGSLFIVGDPKQSIYRFRRADIAMYQQVKQLIADSGGEVLQLTTNFRSVPEICSWVNGLFRNIFTPAAEATGRQAGHVDVLPSRDPVPRGGVYRLDTQTTSSSGRSAETIAAAEADCIAGWIAGAVRGGLEVEGKAVRYADFLLIARHTRHLDVYARALEERSIPYEVTGARAFAEAEEIGALLPLLRAVVEPDDAMAILTHLRGPLCGVDDQTLFEYSQSGGRFNYFAEPLEGADERIAAALAMMGETNREARSLPPAAVIARVIDRLGLLALTTTMEQRGTRSGNLLKMLSLARKFSSDGMSLAEIVQRFDQMAGQKNDIEEMHVEPAREDVVRLMNLHQAKGLEAAFVFLIDPNPGWDFAPRFHVDRTIDPAEAHFILQVKQGKKERVLGLPVDWDAKEQIERDFEEREEERLLYVAATRAKSALIVGIQQKRLARGVEPRGYWSRFAPVLQSTLFPVSGAGEDAAREGPSRDEIDVASMRADLATRRKDAAEVTYSVLPITKVAHPDHATLTKVEEGLGRGTSWGRVLHRLFEAMLRDDSIDVKLYAANLLKDEERDVAETGDVLRAVEQLRSSEIWERIKRADERLVEVPFAIQVPSAGLGLTGPAATLLHGQIDLVFREGDEWFVVDYKSDATRGRLQSLVEYYKPQVLYYAKFWSELTRRKTSAGLFFVEEGRVVWV